MNIEKVFSNKVLLKEILGQITKVNDTTSRSNSGSKCRVHLNGKQLKKRSLDTILRYGEIDIFIENFKLIYPPLKLNGASTTSNSSSSSSPSSCQNVVEIAPYLIRSLKSGYHYDKVFNYLCTHYPLVDCSAELLESVFMYGNVDSYNLIKQWALHESILEALPKIMQHKSEVLAHSILLQIYQDMGGFSEKSMKQLGLAATARGFTSIVEFLYESMDKTKIEDILLESLTTAITSKQSNCFKILAPFHYEILSKNQSTLLKLALDNGMSEIIDYLVQSNIASPTIPNGLLSPELVNLSFLKGMKSLKQFSVEELGVILRSIPTLQEERFRQVFAYFCESFTIRLKNRARFDWAIKCDYIPFLSGTIAQYKEWGINTDSSQFIQKAAMYGSLNAVTKLLELGFAMSDGAFDEAVKYSHLNVAKYFLNNSKLNLKTKSNVYSLPKKEIRSFYKLFIQYNIPIDPEYYLTIVLEKNDGPDQEEIITDTMLIEFIKKNLVDLDSAPILSSLIDSVAASGRLILLEYLLNNFTRAHMSSKSFDLSSENGHNAVVEYLLNNSSIKFSIDAINGALENGYCQVLQLLLSNLDRCDETVYFRRSSIQLALQRDHVEVIELILPIADHYWDFIQKESIKNQNYYLTNLVNEKLNQHTDPKKLNKNNDDNEDNQDYEEDEEDDDDDEEVIFYGDGCELELADQ